MGEEGREERKDDRGILAVGGTFTTYVTITVKRMPPSIFPKTFGTATEALLPNSIYEALLT